MGSKATSKQPRKVRKRMVYQAALHAKAKQLTAPLSEELQKELGIKRLRVRKNDTVLIVRGSFKGHEGRVVKVDVKKVRIYVEGVTRVRSDGREVHIPIHPSKVVITKLDMGDEWRRKVIERRKAVQAEVKEG
ncbi:MAG: 50S ribosomal protein L24 [Thermofilum sp.]|jgi:large subunit ribosomal protein L24|nr:50S ribosomal protein L24 [Thermofilum sp.]MCC6065812.1 50S ribosomal protein L24 [Thermofilum sp.]